ncbi:MAG: hypothetical protein PF569_09370 [Candidatus Woesearchaeota archaeon]|jgi:hypothetical protein|nr:hypothetical protein [Candidatus Woesearchaeota archaeon]
MTFVNKVVRGLESINNIDEYITCWHLHPTIFNYELHEYLGMTSEEFNNYISDKSSLETIINNRRRRNKYELME